MTDATERPGPDPAQEPPRATDEDAWSTACAEDLAAEKVRRRAESGRPVGSAAEELLKLVDAVGEKLSGLRSPLLGAVGQGAAQQAVRQMVQQAKAAVEPVVERNPEVFDHLAAAGSELLAAYRSAVAEQESRWTRREATGNQEAWADGKDAKDGEDGDGTPRRPGDEGTGPGEHIDLD